MTAPTVYDGLCLYHKFDGTVSPLDDSSGYGFSGTLVDAVTDPAGKMGRALRPSNATGHMTVPHARCVAPLPLLSLSLWVYLDKTPATMWGAPMFVDKRNGATGYCFGALAAGSNVLSFRVHNAAGTPYTATYTETVTGVWIHYVCIYNPTTVKIYRNGVEVGTAAADGTGLQNTTDMTIGVGLEGMIDELSLWRRSLTVGEVALLYASGAGLALIQPDLWSAATFVEPGEISPYLGAVELAVPAVPADILPDGVPLDASDISSGDPIVMSTLPDPYLVVEKTKRIFADPNPSIVSVSVASDYTVTAVGNGGPTDALDIVTWWQIDLGPNEVFVMASREASQGFQVNRNQTDIFTVPLRQNWQGLTMTFWMQSAEDASQMWSSAPLSLMDDLWDHSGSGGETYPVIVDGLAALLVARNSWTTTLVNSISDTDTIIAVASVTGLHPAGGVLSIGDEVIHYLSINIYAAYPLLLGCTRGYDGTLAATHGSGVAVEARIVAAHHNRLVDAVRSVEGTVGINPAADPITGGTFANLQDRLNATLPLLIEKPLTADWTFTHTRGRVVSTQFWVLQQDGSYAQIFVPTRQKIDVNGTSTVTVTFDSPQTGFIVVN